MKKINWNFIIFTCLLCLMPICLGLYFYEELPDSMAIHFNINNEADNWASKNFAIFVLPIIMAALQVFCCVVSDINEKQKGKPPKLVKIMKWFIPVLTVVVYTLTILVGLGKTVDVGKVVTIVLGLTFIIMGNYMPKMSYEDAKGNINPMPKTEKVFKKMTRTMGYSFVIGGILMIGAIFISSKAGIIATLALCVLVFVEGIYYSVKNY